MTCTFEADLTAYVDDELEPLRRRQLETHLGGCADCQLTVNQVRSALKTLATLPAYAPSPALRRQVLLAVEAPAGLKERLLAFLRPPVLMPALGMAAAVAVVVWVSRPASTPLPFEDAEQLVVAQNMELLEDFEVVGLEEPDDWEVVANLPELEKSP